MGASHTLFRWISVLVLVLTPSCTPAADPPEAPDAFYGTGVVKRITPSRSFVEIDHGDIPGYMEAMAMHFPVADTALLVSIAPADSVSFTLQAGPAGVVLTAIQRIAP